MDPRIMLEPVDPDHCYSVYELALGVEIGVVIKRGSRWYAMTSENAARDPWKGPIEGVAAATKEEAAEFLLPLLREPELGAP